MLQVHTIKSARGARRHTKKRGRGNASGHGNYSGRGGKGQTARSGGSRGLRLKGFKRLLQSTPKLRGFRSLKNKPAEVYLGDLEKNFEAGATVTLEALKEKKLVKAADRLVKILNSGELTKKLIVSGLLVSKSAAEQIKTLGGEIR